MKTVHSTLLLCSSLDDAMMNSQRAIFNSAGYPVIMASSPVQIQHHVENTSFDIAVLNHTLSAQARRSIAHDVKAKNRAASVLVLHASGILDNPDADMAVDSRSGAAAVLAAVAKLEEMRGTGARHSPMEHEPIVIVDADRNYIFVSDAACRLLGYDRSQFLQLRIDDVVVGNTRVTEPLFQKFLNDGIQQGRIDLRHRSGAVVTVDYFSEVQPDGYMMARWAPVTAQAEGSNGLGGHEESNTTSGD